jgi:hypothetical protein
VKVGLFVAVLLSLLVCGCGSADKGRPYAGVDRYDAGTAAHNIIDQETSDSASRLYNRELAVAGLTKGADPTTRQPAWVITMENFDHVRAKLCLYLWGKFTPFQGSDVTYDIDDCPGSGGT